MPGYIGEVVTDCGLEVIVRHRRSYERDDLLFCPLVLSTTCRYWSTRTERWTKLLRRVDGMQAFLT